MKFIQEAVNAIHLDGVYIFKNIVGDDVLKSIAHDVETNRISMAQNKVGGVYLKNGQYFHSQLLSVSRAFVEFALSEYVHDICKAYFGMSIYRMKCHRYYENYGWYKGQAWHIDNKNGEDQILACNRGLIFIVYFDETDDGAFEYLQGSHGTSSNLQGSWAVDRWLDADYIQTRKRRALGNSGDMIVYDTSLIHRAGSIEKHDTLRRALFMQVDTDMNNGEPMYVMPGNLPRSLPHLSEEAILNFVGFGLPCLPRPWPSSDYAQYLEFEEKLKLLRSTPVNR